MNNNRDINEKQRRRYAMKKAKKYNDVMLFDFSRLMNYMGGKFVQLKEVTYTYMKMGKKTNIVEPFAGTGTMIVNILYHFPKTTGIACELNPVMFSCLKTIQSLVKLYNEEQLMEEMEKVVDLDALNDPIKAPSYYLYMIELFHESSNPFQRFALLFWISLLSMNQAVQFHDDFSIEASYGKHRKLGPKQRKFTIRFFHMMRVIGDRLELKNTDGITFLSNYVKQKDVVKKTFFLLDPPYGAKHKNQKSFLASYDKGWGKIEDQRLAEIMMTLKHQHASFILFNQKETECYLFQALRAFGFAEYIINRSLGRWKRYDVMITSQHFYKLDQSIKLLKIA